MPTFSTPEPITATIDISVGDIRIIAGDRTDTVVEVLPSNSAEEADVRAAEQTRVDFAAGQLSLKGPRTRALGLFGKVGSVDVTVELPAGSRLEAETSVAALRCSGRLGQCRITTSSGDVHLDDTGTLALTTGAGTVVVNQVTGDATVKTGSGKVRVSEIDGNAVIKNANGDNWVGEVRGALRVNTANGDISVDRVGADLIAATANGDVRIGELIRGAASVKTASGRIEFGIRTGTAARLDVHTAFGRVRNQLEPVPGPEGAEQTVTVRARTSYGDIIIRRP
jgi:DUF4097 and DUF4098 domain-containing protein YvlB